MQCKNKPDVLSYVKYRKEICIVMCLAGMFQSNTKCQHKVHLNGVQVGPEKLRWKEKGQKYYEMFKGKNEEQPLRSHVRKRKELNVLPCFISMGYYLFTL